MYPLLISSLYRPFRLSPLLFSVLYFSAFLWHSNFSTGGIPNHIWSDLYLYLLYLLLHQICLGPRIRWMISSFNLCFYNPLFECHFANTRRRHDFDTYASLSTLWLWWKIYEGIFSIFWCEFFLMCKSSRAETSLWEFLVLFSAGFTWFVCLEVAITVPYFVWVSEIYRNSLDQNGRYVWFILFS